MMQLSKTQLKALAAYRQQKRCDEDGVFVVEGVKMCAEALASGFAVRTICALPYWWSTQHIILHYGCEGYEVSDEMLERLSSLKTPNQVWMLLERRTPAVPTPQPLVLALDHLQDPGNLGTIIRTADWFGIRQIVCSTDTVSCYNPKVVQATMGGIFRTAITYCDLPQYLHEAAGKGVRIYGALLEGENVYASDLQTPAILVIGNESRGISPEVGQAIGYPLAIPNLGGTCESLNAAVATAVLCSEFERAQYHNKL